GGVMSLHRIVFAFTITALATACRQAPSDDASTSTSSPVVEAASVQPTTSAAARPALSRVTEASKVCMVNDQYMEKEQIPVTVGGKTYFGCCAMCKEKLEKNEAARMAVDPVSGARVDKANAVIARDASNKVYYFEIERTMRRFVL